MIPVVSFVGYANSGKTTLLTKVIIALKGYGIKVATIKHHHGVLELDTPGTDTWQHSQSGADIVILATEDRIFYTQKIEQPQLEDSISLITDVDIILVEGYKKASVQKIEILREGLHENIISPENELIGIATNWLEQTKLDNINVPKFPLDEPQFIAEYIIKQILKR